MLSSWLISLQLLSCWDCERSVLYPDLQIVWLVVCLCSVAVLTAGVLVILNKTTAYYRVHLSRLPKADKLEWVKIRMKANIASRNFQPGLVKRFPHILWNPNVYYGFHSGLPLVPILNHINSVHALLSCSFKTHFNNILSSVPGYSKWTLSFMFPHQNRTHIPLLPHPFLTPRPFLPPWYHPPNNFMRAVKTMTILIT